MRARSRWRALARKPPSPNPPYSKPSLTKMQTYVPTRPELAALDDKSPATIDRLAGLITDSDAGVRRAAIGGAGPLAARIRCRDSRHGQRRVEDADPSVVLPALQTLAEGGAESVPGLIEALDHPQGRYLGDAGVGRDGARRQSSSAGDY